jgi:hypothetical protein
MLAVRKTATSVIHNVRRRMDDTAAIVVGIGRFASASAASLAAADPRTPDCSDATTSWQTAPRSWDARQKLRANPRVRKPSWPDLLASWSAAGRYAPPAWEDKASLGLGEIFRRTKWNLFPPVSRTQNRLPRGGGRFQQKESDKGMNAKSGARRGPGGELVPVPDPPHR